MSIESSNNSAWTRAIPLLIALATGVLIAQYLPESFLAGRSTDPSGSSAEAAETTGTLWTCGMHPHILEEEPGQCPICHMNLTPVQTARSEEDVLFYRHPMDPTITSPVPAKDSMGMDFIAVRAGETGIGVEDGMEPAQIRIEPLLEQNMNVRTALVERRDLRQPIRTVGTLDYDQEQMVTVSTKYSGWIEEVYVNNVGESVRRGQPLFEIYSPALLQTEQELLSALRFAEEMGNAPQDAQQRAQSMVSSARARLGYWDVSARQIAELEETGEVFRTVQVTAPNNGVVMQRMAGLEGMAVQPGMGLFHIADLSQLWLTVDLFEDQIASVEVGEPAEVTFPYYPGETFSGVVQYLEPEFSAETRTLRARIEVPNPRGKLHKGMFATVELQPSVVPQAIVVPQDAVLRTGERDLVVLALGQGRFLPQEVTLGREAGSWVEVRDGLEAGLEVVTSAQFLLDSESTLRAAIQKLVAANQTAPAEEPSTR